MYSYHMFLTCHSGKIFIFQGKLMTLFFLLLFYCIIMISAHGNHTKILANLDCKLAISSKFILVVNHHNTWFLLTYNKQFIF